MTTAVVTGAASGMGRACVDSLRGLADVIVAADLVAPDIDGTIGVACDVSDPAAVRALAAKVDDLGPFRALAHAAGVSPTMGDARLMFEVDLVGTQLLLDAFEELVIPGSAAVCFASSAAYQVGPFVDADHEALIERSPGTGLPRPGRRGRRRRQRLRLRARQGRCDPRRRAGLRSDGAAAAVG